MIMPPELLQTPPRTEAPMQDEPITECGSRPKGRSAFSSASSVAPGRQTTWRPPSIRCTPFSRRRLTNTISRS